MEKIIKVLHVVNISFVLPYYIGGQFDYFKKRGVDFYVACKFSEHLLTYASEKDFHAIPINVLRQINPWEDTKSIFRLLSVIRKEKIDVVIGHTPKGALLAMVSSYLAGVTHRVYFRHGIMYETSMGLKRMILKSIERITGTLATKVICVSPSVLDVSNSENLSAKGKNFILNKGTCNGVDIHRFDPDSVCAAEKSRLRNSLSLSESDRVIGYVGRIVNDKGIPELIEGWNILKEKKSSIKLLLVGPFEERDSISDHVKSSILNDHTIIHVGLVDNVCAYYGIMNMFILPSHREGFPTVVLEASAMKLPVLTTKVTGCRDSIINNVTGLFTSSSPDDIASKMLYYLDNPVIANEHGSNGRTFVLENFIQEIVWKEIENKIYTL